LPTIGETLKGFSVAEWQGLFAPAGTPRSIVDKIAAEVKKVFEEPNVVAALTKVGGEPATMSPDQFTAFIELERPKWREVVKASGVHID